MKQISLRTGSNQTADQAILKHITAKPGIFSNNNAGRPLVPGSAFHLSKVPPKKSTHLISVISSQGLIGLPTETVCSKIFSHNTILLNDFFQ